MSIQNSTTGEVLGFYSMEELKGQAKLMRGYNLGALCAARSGHAACDILRAPKATALFSATDTAEALAAFGREEFDLPVPVPTCPA
jgi:hypothetical protein